ncbi:MAG: polyphosphate kinase 2 family protein, partial [Acidobacteriota bacterium]
MSRIKTENFRVAPGKKVDLSRWDTRIKPFYGSKEERNELMSQHIQKLAELQNLLYASDRYSLLLIFKAMD